MFRSIKLPPNNTLAGGSLDRPLQTSEGAHRSERKSHRIDDIEVLRAVAVLFVIFHHSHGFLITWPNRPLDFFYKYFNLSTGVNIFFGVSGFVIARSILLPLLKSGSHRGFADITLSFWMRRAWRLLPSAWLWLVLIQLASIYLNESNAFMDARTNFGAMEAGLLNVANFRFADSFFKYQYGASLPYWSLSLEEQFYFLFPILIFVSRRHIAYVAAGLIALQWAFQGAVYPILMHAIATDGLLFGVLIAIWSAQKSGDGAKPRHSRKARTGIMIAAWGLLVLLAGATAENIGAVAYHPAPVTIICTMLVLIASFDQDYFLPPGALKRAMIWIGSRSYALYLIHIPAFCLTREIWFRLEPAGTAFGGTFTLRFTVTALIILAGLSELNYRFVEHPLRVRGAKIAERIRLRRTVAASQGEGRSRWLLAAMGLIWACTLVIAETGRRGLLADTAAQPVRSSQELTIGAIPNT